MKKRVFISFDYDHDSDIKGSLVGQAKLPDSPFEIVDMSIKEAIVSNWKSNARKRISELDKSDCKELAEGILELRTLEDIENKLKRFARN